MRLAYAVTLATLTLLLSGCNGDGGEPADPMSAWTPTGTLDSPSASPTVVETPTEPPLPDAATEATEAGARAFITYYWDLINYAQVTGDVKALKRVSAANCAGCSAGVRGIKGLYAANGHAEGGEYSVSVAEFNKIDGPPATLIFEALLKVRNTEQVTFKGDGTTHTSAATERDVAVAVSWTEDQWRMEVMDPR